MNIEILKLHDLDPDKDIIIVNTYVGNASGSAIEQIVRRTYKQVAPLIEQRGFDVLIVPVTKEMVDVGFKPIAIASRTEVEAVEDETENGRADSLQPNIVWESIKSVDEE